MSSSATAVYSSPSVLTLSRPAPEPAADRETFPQPVDLEPVRALLATMVYSPRCNRLIIETIRRDGSVQCTDLAFLSQSDRDAIEAVLPMAPEEAWSGPKRKGLLWGHMTCR